MSAVPDIMSRVRELIAAERYEDAITLANAAGLGKNVETGHYELWYKDLLKKQKRAYNLRTGRLLKETTLPRLEYVTRVPSARYTNIAVGDFPNNDPTLRWAAAVPRRDELWLPNVPYNEYSRHFFPERKTAAGAGNLEAKMEVLRPTVKPTGIKHGFLNTLAGKLGFHSRRRKNRRNRHSTLKH
jgi:hypothetical protein